MFRPLSVKENDKKELGEREQKSKTRNYFRCETFMMSASFEWTKHADWCPSDLLLPGGVLKTSARLKKGLGLE